MHDRPAAVAAARFCALDSPSLMAELVLPTLPPASGQPPLPLGTDAPDPDPAGAGDSNPIVRQVAASITTAVVEVIAGRRSPTQLDGWVVPDVQRLVERLRFRYSGRDLRLGSLRAQFPAPDVAEVCARLSLDGFGRAAALRISRYQGGWWVTSLMIALPDRMVSRAGRG